MKTLIHIAALLAVLAADAQLGSSYMLEYQTNFTVKAHKRMVATASGDTEKAPNVLHDHGGVLVSTATAAALEQAAANVGGVAAAYRAGFAQGTNELHTALTTSVNSGTVVRLEFPLARTDTRATMMYVPKQEYVGGYDYFYVHFTRPLGITPVIEVPYVWESGMTTNRVAGTWKFSGSDWTNVYSVTVGGIAYTNCHLLRASRPVAVSGAPLFYNPNGKFGKEGVGVNWGNIVLTVDGRPTYSGSLTNTADHTFMDIFNGAILEPGIQEYE